MARLPSITNGLGAIAFVATASAAGAAEDTNNLIQTGTAAYFQQLGWNYQTNSWIGPIPDSSYLGSGATVAIFDGLAYEYHSDLPYNPSPSANPYTDSVAFILSGGYYSHYDLHGTHVSGLVGGRLNGLGTSGVAPEARLLNFAVFDDYGWIGVDQNQLLNIAVAYGASVVSMSYGPTTAGDLALSSTLFAIDSHRSNVVAVVAAGNAGLTVANEVYQPSDGATPLTNLIVVGSVGYDGQLTWYSNRPGESCIVVQGQCSTMIKDIFLVAPGGDTTGIWSTSPAYTAPGSTTDYYPLSGTSMATPQVAGAVALLQSRWPALKLDPLATRNILLDTATDLGAPGTDGVYGRGLLNVYAAMNPIGSPTLSIGDSAPVASPPPPAATPVAKKPAKKKPAKKKPAKKKPAKKPKKKDVETWFVADTQFLANRAFAGLAESDVVISMFDDYNRDFPILLSSLVRPTTSTLSSRFEQIFFDSPAIAEPAIGPALLTPYSLGFSSASGAVGDIITAWSLSENARVFVGRGDPQPLFFTPAVSSGVFGFTDADISGVNPVLGLATGEFFSGLAVGNQGPWRLAIGLTQNKPDQDPTGIYLDHAASALAAAVTYRVSDALDMNVTLTQLEEDGSILGAGGTGAVSFGNANQTNSVTSAWNWRGLAGMDLALSYTLATTKAGASNSLLSLNDSVLSDAFYVAVGKPAGLVEDDRLTFSVSQPLRVLAGDALLYANKALDADGVMRTQTTLIPLQPSGRELDVQMEYGMPFVANGDLSMFAFMAVDSGHVDGETENGLGLLYNLRF